MSFRFQEVDTEFFTPRTYQVELVRLAKKDNLIIPLGTGTGKTFIGVMLIKEMAGDVRKPVSKGGKRSFFLVQTVPLVNQQAEHIRKCTDLKTAEYHGRMNVDLWDKEKWDREIENHHVLVMTAQVFLDLLNHGYWAFEKVNLLIMDECHHAVGNHPYREIMKHYMNNKRDGLSIPRIVGLTASVVNDSENASRLLRTMEKLEECLDSRLETASDLLTVAKYGAKPEITVLLTDDTEDILDSPCIEKAKAFLMRAIEFVKTCDFNPELEVEPNRIVEDAFKRTLSVLLQLGPWCAWKTAGTQYKQLILQEETSGLDPFQLPFLRLGQTYLKAVQKIFDPQMKRVKTVEDLLKYTPNKVARLLDVLKFYKPAKTNESDSGSQVNGDAKGESRNKCNSSRYLANFNGIHKKEEFSGLVFVEQRYIAFILKVLLNYIKRCDGESYGFLNLDFVVGYSGYNISTGEHQSLHKRQEEVLRKFRQKHLNLIIATSVLEEGVDIRQCNCVIRFDGPRDYRAYVQSKGRARKHGSRFWILVEEKEASSLKERLNNFINIEKALLKFCHNRSNPEATRIDLSILDSLCPPYRPEIPEGVRVDGRPQCTMVNAIPLVNRYCQRLPSDIFTRLVPNIKIDEVFVDSTTRQYSARLVLPINSPVKEEIKGPPMPNKKYAQMAVAMKVVETLHKKGELNHHLLPLGKEALREYIFEEDDDEVWPSDGTARPGSTKRRQYYDKRTPSALWYTMPEPEKPVYVHVIQLRMVKALRCAKNLLPLGHTQKLGFVSTRKVPKMPKFPLFTRYGEVEASISILPEMATLNQSQLTQITSFHRYVFSHLLRVEKYSMRFDTTRAPYGILVVPLRRKDGSHDADEEDWMVDFPFVSTIVGAMSKLPRKPSDEERRQFKFDPKKYENAIVMPWYRNTDQPHFYYVSSVLEGKTPASPFPDDEFQSFNDYFEQKYNLPIYNQEQCLLDVDYTSSRLNLLTPRSMSKKQLLASQNESEAQKQILIPELLDIHPISSEVWNQIVCLPSVIYRTIHLLLADELRTSIQVEAFGYTETNMAPDNFEWPPLDCKRNLERYVEELGVVISEDGVTDEGPTFQENLEKKLPKRRRRRRKRPLEEESGEQQETDAGKDVVLNSLAGEVMAADDSMDQNEGDEENFEIGVWDPSLGDGLEWENIPNTLILNPEGSTDPKSDSPMEGIKSNRWTEDASNDSSVVQKKSSVDKESGMDTWDMEMEEGGIYFSVHHKQHFMGTDNTDEGREAKKQLESLLAPREDIVPTGWDVPESSNGGHQILAGPENAIMGGVHFLDVGCDFDANGLMDDILSDLRPSIPATNTSLTESQSKADNWKGMDTSILPDILPVVAPTGSKESNKADTDKMIEDLLSLGRELQAPSLEMSQVPSSDATDEKDLIDLNDFDMDKRKEREDILSGEDIANILSFDEDGSSQSASKDNSAQETPPHATLDGMTGVQVLDPGVNLIDFSEDFKLDPLPVLKGVSDISSGISSSSSVEEEKGQAEVTSVEDEGMSMKSNMSNSRVDQDKKTEEDLVGFFHQVDSFEVDYRSQCPQGPSPCLILQCLTLSNASDGINLERLETVGDSFLKYSITVALFHAHPDKHEGKLSFLRSKQVSNCNLYRLGKRKGLGNIIVSNKFEPSDNWLPPCYIPMEKRIENVSAIQEEDEEMEKAFEDTETPVLQDKSKGSATQPNPSTSAGRSSGDLKKDCAANSSYAFVDPSPLIDLNQVKPNWIPPSDIVSVPYNLLSQHSVADKCIADSVEALIGAYLLTYGPVGAMQFMRWLGLKVLPEGQDFMQEPRAPLLRYVKSPSPETRRNSMYVKHNFGQLEQIIGYNFHDKAYLIQAFTHASYHTNRITDCYQRLEFLGDAVLDYLITRYLYEDKAQHSPGVLTDLRSALVNNTIFASLAIRYKFQKYFLHCCPGLFGLVERFVKMQEEKEKEVNFDEELYLLEEEECCEDEEDIEVPKSMGDVFESVAGAIYLDSGHSLDTVWKVYYGLMKDTLEKCCKNPPKSPIRELTEMEPENITFSSGEKMSTENKTRVTVDVHGKGRFTGIGRNYRIAKCTAAKRALKYLKALKKKEAVSSNVSN